MKTVMGFETYRTWTVRTFPRPDSSKELMTFINSELAIPRITRGPDCLNARKVTTGPPKTRHADLMAIKVGWVLVSSMVGDMRSFRNC